MRIKPIGTYLTEKQIGMIKERIFMSKTNLRKMADEMIISPTTLCNKVNGRSELTQTEIYNLSMILDIPVDEISDYFFDDMLRSATKKQ